MKIINVFTEQKAVCLQFGFVIWQKKTREPEKCKNYSKEFNVVTLLQVGSICIWMQYMCSGYGGGKPAAATNL